MPKNVFCKKQFVEILYVLFAISVPVLPVLPDLQSGFACISIFNAKNQKPVAVSQCICLSLGMKNKQIVMVWM